MNAYSAKIRTRLPATAAPCTSAQNLQYFTEASVDRPAVAWARQDVLPRIDYTFRESHFKASIPIQCVYVAWPIKIHKSGGLHTSVLHG
jgi:hypothetical protein